MNAPNGANSDHGLTILIFQQHHIHYDTRARFPSLALFGISYRPTILWWSESTFDLFQAIARSKEHRIHRLLYEAFDWLLFFQFALFFFLIFATVSKKHRFNQKKTTEP